MKKQPFTASEMAEYVNQFEIGECLFFEDGTKSHVIGSWEARKPVFLSVGCRKNGVKSKDIQGHLNRAPY